MKRKPSTVALLSFLLLAARPPAGIASPRDQGATRQVRLGAPPAQFTQQWVERYNGPANGKDAASAVGVSPDGATVFVTGHSLGRGTGQDYATVAYGAATGSQRWVARYNGPGNTLDFPTALAVSPDGATVYVTGSSLGSGTFSDYATVAYDTTTGAQLWVARYNGPGDNNDTAIAIVVSLDGATVFVTGSTFDYASGGDYATVAYDAATGVERWLTRYNGLQNGGDSAAAMQLSPDGATLFVTGYSAGTGTGDDYATVAYDAATGSQQWVARYDDTASGDDLATAVTVSPDGATVFVTGDSIAYGTGTGQDYATVAYDAATGSQLWTAGHTSSGSNYDYAYAIGVSPDSATVFVTGDAGGDYTTLAYDAVTGHRRWIARYNGPDNGDDGATALAVTADGTTVLVTGHSVGSGTLNFATVAMDAATGAQLAVARTGPGSATALALSTSGVLFVVGSVGMAASDYGTVAYSVSTATDS